MPGGLTMSTFSILCTVAGLLLLMNVNHVVADDDDDDDECPTNIPLKIEGKCVRFQVDPLQFKDARDNCPKLDANARMATVKTEKFLEAVEKLVYDYVLEKMEKAVFWIGLYMDDRNGHSKAAEDRTWKWNYDDTEIVQKDYTLWETKGGPKDKGLTCAAINASNDFLVKPVDGAGPRLPVLCMMEKGRECKDNFKPYLTYGDYCVASLNGGLEYNKILGACNPNTPTPYTEESRMSVIMAAKNSFLGGGVYMNIQKMGSGVFIDMTDNKQIDPALWEEGEPREDYDCVGLSLQVDNTLRLKTMSCEFLASSLCIIGGGTTTTSEAAGSGFEASVKCEFENFILQGLTMTNTAFFAENDFKDICIAPGRDSCYRDDKESRTFSYAPPQKGVCKGFEKSGITAVRVVVRDLKLQKFYITCRELKDECVMKDEELATSSSAPEHKKVTCEDKQVISSIQPTFLEDTGLYDVTVECRQLTNPDENKHTGGGVPAGGPG